MTEPVAWMYELATRYAAGKNGERVYCGWEKHLSWFKPSVPEGSIRNLKPLYAEIELQSYDSMLMHQKNIAMNGLEEAQAQLLLLQAKITEMMQTLDRYQGNAHRGSQPYSESDRRNDARPKGKI